MVIRSNWRAQNGRPRERHLCRRFTHRLVGHVLTQLVKPYDRFRVARSPPVTSRREGSSRTDLWRVWYARALELADLEEAIEKNFEPFLYSRQVIFVSTLSRHRVGPVASRLVGPRIVTQEGYFAGTVPISRHVVDVEVLQLVWSDFFLSALRGFVALVPGGHQLRRNFCVDYRLKNRGSVLFELARRNDPSDQVLNQSLWDRCVDCVMRHVIADAVGRPAERKLAQVGGAEDDSIVQVCQTKQVGRALAGLYVFKSDVVHRLALAKWVADVGEHLHA